MEKLFVWYRSIRMSLMPGCVWPQSLHWRTCRECKFVTNSESCADESGLERRLGIELVRDVDALQQTKRMNYEQAIGELRRNEEKPWRNYSLSNLITRHREARKVERSRRRFAEQFKASPISQAMGTVFGVGLPTKIQAIKIIGDGNRPRDFCVGHALLLSSCPCH